MALLIQKQDQHLFWTSNRNAEQSAKPKPAPGLEAGSHRHGLVLMVKREKSASQKKGGLKGKGGSSWLWKEAKNIGWWHASWSNYLTGTVAAVKPRCLQWAPPGTESDAYQLSNQVCNLNITVVHFWWNITWVWFWAGAWREASRKLWEGRCAEKEKREQIRRRPH